MGPDRLELGLPLDLERSWIDAILLAEEVEIKSTEMQA